MRNRQKPSSLGPIFAFDDLIPICIRKENKARSRRPCCSTARRSNAVIVFNANWNKSDRLLETFEWQAPDVYRKQGYVEASRVDNYVDGHSLAFMRKPL